MFAKKNLIAVAALATLAVSAQAQSSVSLYGNLDVGVAYTKGNGEGAKTSVMSSILTESFFGLKGQEDLGGGLKAVFKLESGINVDTGSQATTNFFGKNAYVGLAGDFGTVKLGNQESLFKTEAAAFDAFGVSPVLAVSKLFVDNTSWQNTVGYTSPNLSGFTVSAQHSLKEGTKNASVNSYNGGASAVAVNYAAGALGLSAVYGDVRTTDTNTGTLSNERNRAFLLGGSYDFGFVKAFAQYGENKSETRNAESPKDKFFQLGAVVPVTQAGSVHVAYGEVKADADKTQQFSLAYHHALSKRTSVYVGGNYKKFSPEDTSSGAAAVGLRHAF